MRGLRQGAYGMMAVVLAVALSRWGFSPAAIGVLVTVSLAGDFVGTLLIGHRADLWGRRRTLVALAMLMALTGLLFGLVRWYPLLLLAAFCGTLGTSASETAPFLPIEQAMLGQLGLTVQRTTLFARYNLVASLAGACGALLAGLPALLARGELPLDSGLLLLFGLYVLAALTVAVLAARLSPAVEATDRLQPNKPTANAKWRRLIPPLQQSRGIVWRLGALFSVDAFAGGLVGQTLLALFFHIRYGADLGVLGVLFFGANLLAALSFLAAPWLAQRFGLLNTMVFTHLPSNVLLFLVPFMPNLPLAGALLLARQCLSQLDVPTRQAYTMALVSPPERTAAASITSLARSAGSAAAPVLAGALLQGAYVALGLPLLLASSLKAGYDLALWSLFRHTPDPGSRSQKNE
ncbi:MAG: MFS transporter [Ktedonobacterales bacterium]